MKIGIDARVFTGKHFTGVSRSVYEVIKVWIKEYPQHDYYLFSRYPINLDFDLPPNWHIVNDPWIIDKGKLWSLFKLPELIDKLDLDVFWGTNYVLPRKNNRTKYFVTIYDLALFKFKGISATSNTIRQKLFTKSACKKADKIIAISEATANDIVSLFNISPKKICVSYCGGMPSDFAKCTVDIDSVNPMIVFPEKYFLFVSTIEPRKNIPTIIKAFEKYIDDTNSDMKLVIAGRIGWKCEETFQTIENCKYKNRIVLPGFITDIEKSYLLSNASVFLYPSLYEGFGIPILEAMEYNVPVITTKISSMPEVGGDGAFYIDNPLDYVSLANRMNEVMSLGEERIECINLMQRQLKKFSWKKNARELMCIFEHGNLEN
ncbi:glycosyltransferase family 4 protein [Neobacillus sp. K501]